MPQGGEKEKKMLINRKTQGVGPSGEGLGLEVCSLQGLKTPRFNTS
jgi:hypothetical protein